MDNERKENADNIESKRSGDRNDRSGQNGASSRRSQSGFVDDDLLFPNAENVSEIFDASDASEAFDSAQQSPRVRRRRSSDSYYRDIKFTDEPKKRRKDAPDDIDSMSINASGFSLESKKKHANFKEILKLIAKLALIAAVIFGLIMLYKLLHVKSVTVSGSLKYSETQLLSQSGIQDGAFILSYTKEKVEDSFEKIPDVSVVSFRRVLPNSIEITVVDKDARAALPAANGGYTLISADGYVISSGIESADGLVLVRGLSGKSYAVGSYINLDSDSASEAAVIRLLEAVNVSTLAHFVTAIDLSNSSCIKLEIGSSFTIILGDCVEAYQNITTAAKAYEYFSREYPEGGIINVFTGSTIVDFTPSRTENGA